jgi:hypothetical protein
MPAPLRTTAVAAVTIAISEVASADTCHHFSIWHFPWPQRCATEAKGNFIREANPPAPSSPLPPKPTQGEEWQRQRAVEKLKEQLNFQKRP